MHSRVLPTISAIAQKLQVERHRVAYITRKLGLVPEAIAGRTGVYSAKAVVAIRLELAEMRRRGGSHE